MRTPQSSRGVFVTGTDTGVGKTLISAALMGQYHRRGRTVAGMKPVASGCRVTPEGLRNDDALLLQGLTTAKIAYESVNPYAFEPPIAPHLAALESGVTISLDTITDHWKNLGDRFDVTVVEGVGGWRVPLNSEADVSDLAVALGLPVILVVGVRLGCINHALLTLESMARRRIQLAGWVACTIERDMPRRDENVATLRELIDRPPLAYIPYLEHPDPASISRYLNPVEA